MDTKERARIATAAATRARRMTKWRRWAAEMRENGFTVAEPGEASGPLPLSVGRIQSYCGRVDRPHTGHVWTTQPGRWCPGDVWSN